MKVWTVGWGTNIHHLPLSDFRTVGALLTWLSDHERHKEWLTRDLNAAELAASVWLGAAWGALSKIRQDTVSALFYQMGEMRMATFVKLKAALLIQDWSKAADEMTASRWSNQTPERAARLIERMRQG